MKGIAKLTDISVTYENNLILDKVSLIVMPGEITTIIGPNGSGKTTLAKALIKIIEVDSGLVEIAANTRIGYMPQKITISPYLPITVKRFLCLQKDKIDEIHFSSIIKLTNTETLLKKQILKLSGGEMQRVMLAHALISKPNLLVLDEPVQNLDITGQVDFYELLEKIRAENNIAIIMISHDLYMVMKTTDHVLCLNHHICCEGSPQDITIHPEYLKLFTNKNIALYSHHHDHIH